MQEENIKKKERIPKTPSLLVAIIPLLVVVVLMLVSLFHTYMEMAVPLIVGSVVGSFLAVYLLGYKWAEVEKGIFDSLLVGLQPFILIGVVGMLVGSWMVSGIVPATIYYSLQILSPNFFLITCMLICSVVSFATGGSWTTAGTIGLALVGVGQCMGIPNPITAGAIISGSYFGDKMSPFSDTTNMAPAVAGTTLFAHIKHMVYTTGVSYVLALIGFAFLNRNYSVDTVDTTLTNQVLEAIEGSFNITPVLLLPMLLIIVMMVMKVPLVPGLMANVAMGLVCAVIFQKADLGIAADSLMNGYVSATGSTVVDELLTGGGIYSMTPTLVLIMCAFVFAGVLRASGMLEAIARAILKLAKTDGALISATLFTAVFMNAAAGEQYMSILLTGSMYKEEYEMRGLAPENLSRCLEDAGTLTSPLIPWCACAVAMSGYLGVATVAYLPYCLLNIINPIVSLIYGLTGFTIKKLPPKEES